MARRKSSHSTGLTAFMLSYQNTTPVHGIPSNIFLYSHYRKDSHMDAGLLLIRLVFGLVMAAHGAQKLFGWFGGYGITGTGGFFESLGFRPGKLFAAAAGFGEFAGGLLVALGFLRPIGPALMLSVMIVAAVSVPWGHLFATHNGIEVP